MKARIFTKCQLINQFNLEFFQHFQFQKIKINKKRNKNINKEVKSNKKYKNQTIKLKKKNNNQK